MGDGDAAHKVVLLTASPILNTVFCFRENAEDSPPSASVKMAEIPGTRPAAESSSVHSVVRLSYSDTEQIETVVEIKDS